MRLIAGVLAVALAAVSGSVAAKSPEQLVLTAESQDALIILQTPWWPPAPSMQSAFKLALTAYDPDQQKLSGGLFSKFVLVEAKKSNFIDDYLVAKIKPGRWVAESYSEQDLWSLCFNARTIYFEVKPGEVVYLGAFNAGRHSLDLRVRTTTSGKVFLRNGSVAQFFDLPTPPLFSAIEPDRLAAAAEMVRQRMPRVTVPVTAVQFTPGKFGTGSSLLAERRCSGYFTTSAKEKDQSG